MRPPFRVESVLHSRARTPGQRVRCSHPPAQVAPVRGIGLVTIEDKFDANLVVYAKIGERDRAALLGARLLVAEGRVERVDEHAEVPILHVIARRLIDRSDLLDGSSQVDGSEVWDRMMGRADEVRRPDPGSRRPTKMPQTRNFR